MNTRTRIKEIKYSLSYFRNTHSTCTGQHCYNCRKIAKLQDELIVIAAQAAIGRMYDR